VNAQPDSFAVMNCCVEALSVYSSDILTWGADILVLFSAKGARKGLGWVGIKLPA